MVHVQQNSIEKKYGQGDSYISKCMQGHVEANSQWGGRSLHAGG